MTNYLPISFEHHRSESWLKSENFTAELLCPKGDVTPEHMQNVHNALSGLVKLPEVRYVVVLKNTQGRAVAATILNVHQDPYTHCSTQMETVLPELTKYAIGMLLFDAARLAAKMLVKGDGDIYFYRNY